MKINDTDKQKIKDAISELEKHTLGEVVPVILKQSDFYPAAHFRLAMIFSVLFSLIYYTFFEFNDAISLIWASISGMLIGYIFAFIPFLKKMMSTKDELEEEVYQRAIQTFFEHNISSTKERIGIMLFISILEKKIHIIADSGINSKVDKNYWNELVSSLSNKIKTGQAVDGMLFLIEDCGKTLKQFFPKQQDNSSTSDNDNEIPNDLVTDI